MKKTDYKVIFWHNDFNNSPSQNSFYGPNGPISKRVAKNLPAGTSLEWHFHGGFINEERHILLKRLREADVLFAACPWNMDINDNNMHWEEAEASLLNVLKEIRKENKGLKVFFLQKPFHPHEFFEGIGDFMNDVLEEGIYRYFTGK